MRLMLLLVVLSVLGCATDQGLPMVTSRGERIIYVGPKEFYPNIRKGDVENYRCLAGVLLAESYDGFHFDLRCVN